MANTPMVDAALLQPGDKKEGSGEHTPTDTVVFQPRGFDLPSRARDQDAQDSLTMSTNWWGDRGSSRPWHNPPKCVRSSDVLLPLTHPRRRKTIPPDQTVAFERTKTAVRKAASVVLDLTHESLIIASEALRLAPVMGLAEAARVLLCIWDSVEAVQVCILATQRSCL